MSVSFIRNWGGKNNNHYLEILYIFISIVKIDTDVVSVNIINSQRMTWYVPRNTFSSVQFSRSVMSDFLQHHGLQHARPPYPSPTPRVYSNSCPLSHWCHPTISSSSPPTFNLSQHQGLFQWVSSLYQVAQVLEFQLQHQSLQWIFRTDFL